MKISVIKNSVALGITIIAMTASSTYAKITGAVKICVVSEHRCLTHNSIKKSESGYMGKVLMERDTKRDISTQWKLEFVKGKGVRIHPANNSNVCLTSNGGNGYDSFVVKNCTDAVQEYRNSADPGKTILDERLSTYFQIEKAYEEGTEIGIYIKIANQYVIPHSDAAEYMRISGGITSSTSQLDVGNAFTAWKFVSVK
ncbi:hypothetical protein GTQ43_03585 [Nostoc sp. KVJ3]|uniref:hypothetical protein n=1 Tax=Nostoc sp. KVJ3 TaxID=457945 RepID=UPI0022372253|nr:hypothetical protein [Nostoc sp. KVJ3]MCW5312963.1 hypothetical protein [Nostoc sp. KVJ3]